jgi:hypothetical protein
MLFRETVAVCCENHTEHTDTDTEFQYDKACGIYSYHCVCYVCCLNASDNDEWRIRKTTRGGALYPELGFVFCCSLGTWEQVR